MKNQRKTLSFYQGETGAIIASFANALSEIADISDEETHAKQKAIIASLSSSLQHLTASLSKSLVNETDNQDPELFISNSMILRSRIKDKLRDFLHT